MRPVILVALALALFTAGVSVVGVQPARVGTVPEPAPARFQRADAWVPDHLGANIAFFGGTMTSPTGRVMLVWNVYSAGTTFTSGGHRYAATMGSIIGVTINLHDPSYVGPVFLMQPGHPWVLVTTQP